MARPNLTRAKVLEAAAELAAVHGVTATTVDDIARHAGIAKGSVYYNFDTKEAIFAAVIDEAIGRALERMRAGLAGAAQGLATRSVASAFLTGVEERPAVSKIVAGELFRTDRPWRESLAAHRAAFLAVFGEALAADGRTSGTMQAAAVFGATVTVGFERLAFSPNTTLAEALDAIVPSH